MPAKNRAAHLEIKVGFFVFIDSQQMKQMSL
jgi:hypothetical protein